MNRNRKFMFGIIAIIIIAIPTGVLSWMFLFRESPSNDDQLDPKYADLSISTHSLEKDNLTFTVQNQGEKNAAGIEILVEIYSLSLILYNNSLSPLDLETNELFQISINLTDYHLYLLERFSYLITISIDPENVIEEGSEANNLLIVDYIFVQEGVFYPNTYANNSTIGNLAYAVHFNETDIFIEDSLNILNGYINGYSIANSTILNNSILLNNQTKISFALYGNQNLTLNNIWNTSINLMLFDNSSVSLYNSSIYDLRSFGNNSIHINNSTLKFCITSGTEKDKNKVITKNNTYIEQFMILVSSELEIESSSINTLMVQPTTNFNEMKGYEITGEITDSMINSFAGLGKSEFLIDSTNISSANLMGSSKVTFHKCLLSSLSAVFSSKAIVNESEISNKLTYGLTISSGSVNVTNGEIEGDYLNTTELINSNVSDSSYDFITVNGTGQLSITNFSCNILLYDAAKLVLNEANINSSATYTCYLQDNSELFGNNCSFESLLAYGESIIKLENGSIVNMAILNTSNLVDIENSSISQLILISDNRNGETSRFTYCTIDQLFAYPHHKVNLTNSTINNLYEGFILGSGDIDIDPSGISGAGNSVNYITLEDTTCYNRSTKYLTIKDDINVSINNIYRGLVIHIDNGTLHVFNSTISSLQMKFDSIATLNNCSFEDIENGFSHLALIFGMGNTLITCCDNSKVIICNNTKISNQYFGIQMFEFSEILIEDSQVKIVDIYNGAKLNALNSEISQIIVYAYRPEGYSVTLNNSTLQNLITFSWNFTKTGETNMFTGAIFMNI
ncbi:MAG: hypothetical protein GF311_15525 [Candidatus Lokiarchaeota archaeon]|nr:hypothetical protein [Candidatus Lokiarchaeota archaeon]